jgi:hypothetical protein
MLGRGRPGLLRALKRGATRAASWVNLALVSRRALEEARAQRRALFELARAAAAARAAPRRDAARCVVFSRDRPMQLHALLSSYFEKAKNPAPVHVLYRASSARFEAAYREVLSFLNDQALSVTRETSFRDELLRILWTTESEKVFFLVDDLVFVEDVDIADFTSPDTERFVPTLRLGKNLRRCYTGQARQPLPPFLESVVADRDKLCWRWADGKLDWGYPLSVDGHLFGAVEIALMAQASAFAAPNSFERALQGFADLFSDRYGVGYAKSKIVNLPLNRVQHEESRNIAGPVRPEYLLERWEAGFQIDYRSLYGWVNESAHQELPLRLVRRRCAS